jgi:malectin (di-glucose binding ER protein)
MKSKLGVFVCAGIFGLLCLPATAQAQTAIRVKCGGSSYTDSRGHLWHADFGFNTGSTFSTSASINGTPDQALYQTGRTNSSTSTSLLYRFALPNGNYHVNLYFAETFNRLSAVGRRVFTVKLQGNPVFPNLDIFATIGADAALVEGIDFVVANGEAAIEFDNVVRNSLINAIEILPVSNASPALALSFVYPDGTPVSGSLTYTISSSLLTFRGSVPLANGQAQCELLTSPIVLGLNTQFQVNLSLSDNSGNSLWQFTLGINPSQINLGAIQSSALKVVVQKP